MRRRRSSGRGFGRFQRPELLTGGISGTPLAGLRRIDVLRGIGALGFSAVGVRLGYLQVENALNQLSGRSSYSDAANENRFDVHIVPPPRGVIYDRFGEVLANSSPNYRVMIVPERAEGQLEAVLERLGLLLDLSPEAVARSIRRAKQARRFDAVLVKEGLDWQQFTAVNVFLPELPGVKAEAGELRYYPYKSAFAHPIGYVQRPSQKEIDEAEVRSPGTSLYLRHPDVRVGRSGLETMLEPQLQGEPGWRKVEVNASGRVVSEVAAEERQAVAGGGVVLTLDGALQRTAMERMGGESGAAVLMDAQSGELLVLASAPGFDPNAFVNGIGTAAFRALNEDEYKPLFHKAVTGAYKPGSTFKIVTALAALQAGMNPKERVNCPGYYVFGGRPFHCWKKGGHGSVDMHTAMKGSCNVFFFQAALRAGQDRIAAVARALGFGTAFDVSLPSVQQGIVPDEAWWTSQRSEPFPAGMTLNTGIGQGDLLVTPLQLAVATARLTSGMAVEPRLIREADRLPQPKPPKSLNILDEHRQVALGGMYAVCNEPGGTAIVGGNLQLVRETATGRILPEEPGRGAGFERVLMAGKTGTAQVRVITAAERATGVKRNEDLPWRLRDHALFICVAPWDKPRYACAVVVEHGMAGSRVAAPIARDIMREALLSDPVNRTPATLAELASSGKFA